ncbi:hypothetical protein BJX63DRAFT_433361 [Aspergillus granulosus]|uniref:Uncharacterized protein n=1 Tax=Aspergillus granulosus TaxID=176169 RepID=A0ABR4H7T2_9EURO
MWKDVAIPVRHLTRAALYAQATQQTFLPRTLAQSQSQRAFTSIPRRQAQPQDEEDHYHDRNALDPSRTEASQSGTTDEVSQRAAAFDPSKTSPESEIGASREQTRREGSKRDPLGVSAGDKDVGRERDPMEGSAEKNVDKEEHSSRGSARKNRETKAGRG